MAVRIACRNVVGRSCVPLPEPLLPLIGEPSDRLYRQRLAEAALEWIVAELEAGADPARFTPALRAVGADDVRGLVAAWEWIVAG